MIINRIYLYLISIIESNIVCAPIRFCNRAGPLNPSFFPIKCYELSLANDRKTMNYLVKLLSWIIMM